MSVHLVWMGGIKRLRLSSMVLPGATETLAGGIVADVVGATVGATVGAVVGAVVGLTVGAALVGGAWVVVVAGAVHPPRTRVPIINKTVTKNTTFFIVLLL